MPRRVNFVAIQHEHGVACPGYRQSMVRTGYEGVIGQRTTDLFCYAAKKDGEVVSIAKEGIIIKYDDGETKGIELGRRYGNDSGLVFSHDVVTNMTVGQKFKAGNIVAYNTGFFEPDVLDPTNVVWKVGCLVDTVLFESPETHEDASTISSRLAAKLSTKTTKIKTVVVEFDKVIRDIVKPGQVVDHETVLCVIEDSITSNANLFTEDSLDTLRVLSSQTPVAKVQGVIDRIEVIYHGEKEDMSDSLRKIADQSDRELSARMKAVGKKPLTGGINEDLRVNEDSLAFESMAIRFYITTEVKAGLGDWRGLYMNPPQSYSLVITK